MPMLHIGEEEYYNSILKEANPVQKKYFISYDMNAQAKTKNLINE